MPIYEFTCKKCGIKFEEFVRSLNDENEFVCPQCGSKESERLFSVFSSSSSSSSASSSCSPVGGFS